MSLQRWEQNSDAARYVSCLDSCETQLCASFPFPPASRWSPVLPLPQSLSYVSRAPFLFFYTLAAALPPVPFVAIFAAAVRLLASGAR
jgi:hypothetical protein